MTPGYGRWAAVVGLLVLATAACWALDPYVSLTSQSMIYVLAVVIASYRLDWRESAVCAAGAVTALNYFFVPPRWTFAVDSREHLIALASCLRWLWSSATWLAACGARRSSPRSMPCVPVSCRHWPANWRQPRGIRRCCNLARRPWLKPFLVRASSPWPAAVAGRTTTRWSRRCEMVCTVA
ncbi:MAG: DUF4118 domain-containing protein [Burkholderiaceae bacterium]|nr:DUF4118 domain-containing protein [Hydrogenophaga sp.]MDO8280474.1 DUF4118 domain-containing protein [Burkholderiaceae bacterium]MDO9031037.1 DUF4118 domain-containing protein [Hydrogenophaga sp.]